MAATLKNQPVQCTTEETARFDPPPNQTCGSYAGAFADASPGYLLNSEATSACAYCPFTTGDDYLSTLNISADDKWRDFGIFLVFVVTNWALVYFFVYSVRVRGWKFGFGLLFGGLSKVMKKVTGLFSRKSGRDGDEQ